MGNQGILTVFSGKAAAPSPPTNFSSAEPGGAYRHGKAQTYAPRTAHQTRNECDIALLEAWEMSACAE